MYRRSMSAFQLVSLIPTYHLVNGYTSGRVKWAHGRQTDSNPSRVQAVMDDPRTTSRIAARDWRDGRGFTASCLIKESLLSQTDSR